MDSRGGSGIPRLGKLVAGALVAVSGLAALVTARAQQEEWSEPVFDSLAGRHLVAQWRHDKPASRVREFHGAELRGEWIVPRFAITAIRVLPQGRFAATGNAGEAWITRIYEARGDRLEAVWSSAELAPELTAAEPTLGELAISPGGDYWVSAVIAPPLRVVVGEVGGSRRQWSWEGRGDARLDGLGVGIRGLRVSGGRPPAVAVHLSGLDDDVLWVDPAKQEARFLDKPEECESLAYPVLGRDAIWASCQSTATPWHWMAFPLDSGPAVAFRAASLGISLASRLVSTSDRRVLLVDTRQGRVVEVELAAGSVEALRSGGAPELAAEPSWTADGVLLVSPDGAVVEATPWESILETTQPPSDPVRSTPVP